MSLGSASRTPSPPSSLRSSSDSGSFDSESAVPDIRRPRVGASRRDSTSSGSKCSTRNADAQDEGTTTSYFIDVDFEDPKLTGPGTPAFTGWSASRVPMDFDTPGHPCPECRCSRWRLRRASVGICCCLRPIWAHAVPSATGVMPTSDFRGQQWQPPHQQQQQPLHQPSSRHLRPSVIARQAKDDAGDGAWRRRRCGE